MPPRPLLDVVIDFIADVRGTLVSNSAGQMEERIHASTIMQQWLGISTPRAVDYHAVAAAMRALGWQGPQPMRIGNALRRGYWRYVQTRK
jgi:hypothetical protein